MCVWRGKEKADAAMLMLEWRVYRYLLCFPKPLWTGKKFLNIKRILNMCVWCIYICMTRKKSHQQRDNLIRCVTEDHPSSEMELN